MGPSIATFRPVCKNHPLRSKAQRDGGTAAVGAGGPAAGGLPGRGFLASLPDEDLPMFSVQYFRVLFLESGLRSPPLVT